MSQSAEDYSQSDEMRNALLFKYMSTAAKPVVTKIATGKQQSVAPKKQQAVEEKKFTYDFSEDLKKVTTCFDFTRLNPETHYSVPEELLTKPVSPYLVGNIEKISNILIDPENYFGKVKTVCGWARTVRNGAGGALAFIELNDGSCLKNLQVLPPPPLPSPPNLPPSP